MEVTSQTPTVIKTDYFPWKQTYLIPVGDVQLGASGVDTGKLRVDIKRGLKLLDEGNEVFFIGMGDYVDVASPSNRKRIKAADLYDSVVEALEENANQQVNKFLNLVKGTEGRWLGILQGHHYYEFGDGRTSDTIIADNLDAKFLGDSALIRMLWKLKGSNRIASLDIFAHHGVGSGQTQAAPLAKLEKFAGGTLADIYLINHYARRGAIPADQIYLNQQGHFRSKTIYYVATGGYMRAYEQGSKKAGRAQGSYVEKGMMKPVTLGGVVISLTPQRSDTKEADKVWIEIGVQV